MAVYTQLQERDVREIGSKYNLTVIDYEPVTSGAANSNYLLRAQRGEYVLTMLESKSFERAVELGQLLLLLKEHTFPTTRPLFADNGEIAALHNGKPVMVKVYVEGKVRQDLSEAMLFQIGAAMAKLHQVPSPDFLMDRQPYGLREFPKIQGQNSDPAYEAWIAERFSELAKQRPEGLPRGLIHGDLFYDNVLFEGPKLKAVIDFEEALYEDKVFDLGMGVVGLCRNGATVVLEKTHALVKGYEQVRILEEREKHALQLFIEYAATTVSCWRYWKYHVDAPSGENAGKHRQMVRVAEEIRGVPKARMFKAVFG